MDTEHIAKQLTAAIVTIETKPVVEFGQAKTLYRVIGWDGWGTLWHSTLDKAYEHYLRHEARAARG